MGFWKLRGLLFMQEFLVFFLPDKPELAMNGIFLQIYVKEIHDYICYLKKYFFMWYIYIWFQRL